MRATLAARWTPTAGWRALQADSALASAVACGALLLVLGVVYALFTPPFQVPDEPAHFLRAYELAEGRCKAPLSFLVPFDVLRLVDRFPNHIESSEGADDMNARLAAAHARPRSGQRVLITAADTAAGYSCLPYVPAAAGVAFANLLRLPMIDVLYAARLASACVFALAATLALLLLPPAMRPFAMLLFGMPMALAEAGSSAQDPIINAASFLYVAYVAHLAWERRSGPIGNREIAILLALAVVLGQCKINLLLTPLVLLVPRSRWGGWKRAAAGSLAAVVLSAVSFVAWQHFGATSAEVSPLQGQDSAANEHFLLVDPGVFLGRLGATLRLNWAFYIDSFVGRLGWLSVSLPRPLVFGYALALLAAMLAAPAPDRLTPLRRLLGLAVAAGSTGATFLVFWVVASPELIIQYATGTGYIEGVQGRYLIPYALVLGLALAGLLPLRLALAERRAQRWALAACAALIAAASGTAYYALYRAYYYPQYEAASLPLALRHPARRFEHRFVHQIAAGSDPDQIFYVHHGHRFWIETPRWFRKHHVSLVPPPIVLPAAVIRRIPVGEVVFDPDFTFDRTPAARRYYGQFVTDGRADVWLVSNGVRHHVVDSRFIRRNRYPVASLSRREFADIPVGDPLEDFRTLDGQLIQATDARDPVERARVYIVEDGIKRWIVSADWLTRRGMRLDQVRPLPAALVDRVPEGLPVQ